MQTSMSVRTAVAPIMPVVRIQLAVSCVHVIMVSLAMALSAWVRLVRLFKPGFIK